MGVFTYIQIFATFWCSMLLTIAPGLITYKQFAFISAIGSALVILFLISEKKQLPKTTVVTAAIYLLIILLYYLTPGIGYRTFSSEKHHSLFLALTGQVFPAVITATLLVHSEKYSEQIKKCTPFVSILFSVVSLYVVLFHNSATSGGYIRDENNLNYQSTSYLAAYAAALAQYSLIERKKVCYCYAQFGKRILVPTLALTIVSDLYVVFSAGGRGGFVTCIVLFGFSFLIINMKHQINLKSCLSIFCLLFIVTAGFILIFSSVKNTGSVENSGFERIIGFLEVQSDANRSDLRNAALNSFKESPILGHGISSVFYEIGEYSHNCFTDFLVEGGMIGFIIFCVIIFATFRKGFLLAKKELSNSLWLYIFLCGFLMSLFSGYYLVLIPLNWGIVFILSNKRIDDSEQEQMKHG